MLPAAPASAGDAAAAPPEPAGAEAPHAPAGGAHVPLLAMLTVAHLVVDTYATVIPSLLPFWQERFSLTYGLAGLITGIANITSSVAQPLIGVVTDRGRDPRWIAIACLVAAAGIAAAGLAPSYPLFLACVVIGGLGVSGFHPLGYKLTGLFSGSRSAAATSWFLVGGNVGVALGPLLGAAVVLRFGLGGTSLLLLPGLALAGVMWWLVPRWTASARRRSGPAGAAAPTAPHAFAVASLSLRQRTGALAVLIAVVATRTMVSSSLVSFIPLYYVRVAGTGEAFASQVLSGMLFVGAVATLAGGYLADRLGRLRVLSGTLLALPPLLLLYLALAPASVAAVALLWAAGAIVTASFSITVVLAQELWFERRAVASGLIVGFAFGIGGLLVPIVGAVADRWGLVFALQVVALLPFVSLLLVALLAIMLRRAHAAGHAPG